MRSPLEARISALRWRVRRLLALHGLSRVVGLVILAVIVATLADWLTPGHLVREVRLALLLAILGLAAWLSARFVIAPLVVRFRDLDIAFKIERRWPGLNDRLASTVQFLTLGRESGDRDDVLGSQALRDATVAQTLKEVEAIDFREAIDPRPARRAMLACASVLALGLAIVMTAPDLSRIGLTRLLNPFSTVHWPQQTHLTIVKLPAKIARGEDVTLEVAVAKGERLPSTVKATYRYDDGRIEVEPLRADPSGRFHGRREAVETPFRVTIAGGDDVTAPRRVEVVPPPRLTALTIRLTPPSYTGLPRQTLAPGRTEFQAVRGTLVEIEAQANKPLASAVFHLGDAATMLPASRQGVSGRSLATRFQVAESAPFSFALTDTEGFKSQDRDATRFEVHALRDEEPRVNIDEPSSDRDVTANATVPVRIAAEDDYGLGLVRLLYKVASGSSEPSAETIIPLWAAEPETSITKRVEVPHDWDLAPLKLSPGTIITFLADARDLDAIHPKGPKTGRSRELRLRIATVEEINRQMDAQRVEIREAVQRILAMEKQAQVPVREAEHALDQLDRLDKAARDDLANAAVIQRQVGERVNSPDDGLDQKIQRYLDDLKNLKLDNPEVKQQMEQMQAGVARIQDNHLTPAEQELTRATKALDDQDQDGGPNPEPADAPKPSSESKPAQAKDQSTTPAPKGQDQAKSSPENSKGSPSTKGGDQAKAEDANDGQPAKPSPAAAENEPKAATADAPAKSEKTDPKTDAVKEALAQASDHQEAIAEELTRMLDGLKEFDTIRGVVQDAKKLLKDQEELMKQAAEAAAQPDLVGKTTEALTPEQKVGLDNLAARQGEQAKEVQNLENKMDEMSGRIDESDPLGASSLRDAARQSREQGTASKMNDAASGLETNRMGEAKANQEQARNNLKELIENLQNRREHELAGLVKELRNAEKDLKNLRGRQAKNKEATGKAKQNPNDQERKDQLQKLAKEQEEIQKELKKQLQKLKKLRADAAAQAGSRATGKMSKAQQDQEDDDAEAAEQNQEDALADLDDAQEEIKKARQEAEEQLAMEQLAKMADTLKDLGEQQDKLLAETVDYQAKQAEGQGLSPSRKASVRGLGRAQGALKDETNSLIERLTEAPVFKLILERATKSMDLAAQRLREIQTDDETQVAQRTASRRLKQLLDALKPDKGEAGPPQKGGEGEGGGGGGGGGDAITKAAQIKMLRMLQLELNDRTEELDALRQRPKGITPEQEQELDRLETDQRTIADLTIDLTKPKRDDGEED